MELFNYSRHEQQNNNGLYQLSAEGGAVVELPKQHTLPLKLTREYLFGTQLPNEYKKSKKKRVQQGYSKFGIRYIQERPVIACAVPYSEMNEIPLMRIAILDGHHRVRLLGVLDNADFVQIQTFVINTTVAADLYKTSIQNITTRINNWMDETIYAFDRHLSHYLQRYKQPHHIPISYDQAPFIWQHLYPEYLNALDPKA